MASCLISIIVPVYNTIEYLPRLFNSLETQINDEIEIIIVDDGSQDGSAVECDKFAALHGCARVIHQSNAGVSSARNVALDIALGKYVWFVDSDDQLASGAIPILTAILKERSPEVVAFPAIMEDGAGERIGLIPAPANPSYHLSGPLVCGDSLYPFTHILARDLIGEERFDSSLTVLEDRDFLYRVLEKVNEPICILTQPLYIYYSTRPGSAINSLHVQGSVLANGVNYRIMLSEIEAQRIEPAYTMYVDDTLAVLAYIAKTGCCRESFKPLYRRLLSFDAYSRDLRGLNNIKYFICKNMPLLYKGIYHFLGGGLAS